MEDIILIYYVIFNEDNRITCDALYIKSYIINKFVLNST